MTELYARCVAPGIPASSNICLTAKATQRLQNFELELHRLDLSLLKLLKKRVFCQWLIPQLALLKFPTLLRLAQKGWHLFICPFSRMHSEGFLFLSGGLSGGGIVFGSFSQRVRRASASVRERPRAFARPNCQFAFQ